MGDVDRDMVEAFVLKTLECETHHGAEAGAARWVCSLRSRFDVRFRSSTPVPFAYSCADPDQTVSYVQMGQSHAEHCTRKTFVDPLCVDGEVMLIGSIARLYEDDAKGCARKELVNKYMYRETSADSLSSTSLAWSSTKSTGKQALPEDLLA